MITFSPGCIRDIHVGGKDLIEDHYKEVNAYPGETTLNVDWENYYMFEKNGYLATFLARDGLCLVGYIVFFLQMQMHNKGLTVALCTDLFLSKPHRKGMLGVKFMKYAEEKIISLGLDKITWCCTTPHDLSPILKRMEYAPEEVRMSKLIKRGVC